ncbi:hypothetical protein ACFLZS_01915 [Patescibacteria group bacterium]
MGLEFTNLLTIRTEEEFEEFIEGELFESILKWELEYLSIVCPDKFPPILIHFNPKKGWYPGEDPTPAKVFISMIDETISTMIPERFSKKFRELFPEGVPLYRTDQGLTGRGKEALSPIPKIIGRNNGHIIRGMIEAIIRQLIAKGFIVEIGEYNHE